MAVQLLEEWLLNEQEQIRQKYHDLNRISVKDPDVLFLGDSIVEYFPLHELLKTSKTLINRGIRGYRSDLLLEHLESLLFGQAVVTFVNVYDDLLDETGQLKEAFTTDGLHLTVAGYQVLAERIAEQL